MKKIFLLLIVHCALLSAIVISPLNAQTSIDVDWKRAEELYANKQYTEAADVYAEMFQYGESAALYYNYANTLYKSNQIGLAILNYERALRLDPTNEDIRPPTGLRRNSSARPAAISLPPTPRIRRTSICTTWWIHAPHG